MATLRLICLVGLGGAIESLIDGHAGQRTCWLILFGGGALGWGWAAFVAALHTVRNRVRAWITGRPIRQDPKDPAVLADEIANLRAQIANLRDTAISYDLSFDDSLQRIDERLKNVERTGPSQPLQRVR